MTAVSSRTFFFVLLLALAGCSDPGSSPGDDAAVANPDASDVDAYDPYATPEMCSSGSHWTLGNRGSTFMHPGLACIDCHNRMRGPFLTIGGTVYPSAHEPDDCDGVNGFDNDVHVIVTDANGNVQDLQINDVGNFYSQGALTLPITAELTYQGRSRVMTTPATSGDCNACHTDTGTNAAPGRLVLP